MIDPGITNLTNRSDALSHAALQVDVIADVICPWCFLGKRRLDDALAAVHGPSVVSWYPFQLNPSMPVGGVGFDEYLATRFGDASAVQPALDHLIETGREHGVNFRFDRIRTVPNTLDAHRLMQLADRHQRDTSALAEYLMQGFFEDGQDTGDRDVLVALGERVGLRSRVIHETLEDETSRQIVLSQEAQVRKGGVTGVPNFLVNKRLFVTGAQSTEILVNVFDRAMFGEESDQPASEVVH